MLCAGLAQAQSIPWHYKLTVGDGLSGNIVTCIQQGPRGRMWFGTSQGLSVYDGHSFENLLPETYIYDIVTASDSMVLFSTSAAVYQYNVLEGEMQRHRSVDGRHIRQMVEYRNGSLLVANADSLFLYRPNKGLSFVFNLAPFRSKTKMKSSVYVSDIAVAKDGSIWVAGMSGRSVHLDSNFQVIAHHMAKGWSEVLHLKHDSLVFYSSEYQLFVQHPETGQFILAEHADSLLSSPKDQTLRNFRPKYVAVTSNNLLWYTGASEQALLRFNPSTTSYTTLRLDGIDFSKTHCLYEDATGTLWLGTEQGVVMLRIDQKQVTRYFDRSDQGLPAASIRGITEDEEGKLYIATYAGFFVAEPERDTVYRLPNFRNTKAGRRVDTRCYALLREGNSLWMATESFGLYRYEIDQQSFVRYPSKDEGWLLGMSLLRDRNNRLWMGTRNGLYRVNEANQIIEHVAMDAFKEEELPAIYDLHEDQQGRMWLGTDKGLYQCDPDENRILKRYHPSSPPGSQLSHHKVFDIHEDDQGVLWLATKGGGICRLQADSGTVKVFAELESVEASNMVASIIEDEEGWLWLGTFNGLVRFNKQTGATRTYLAEDGLSHSEFNHKAAYRRKNGQLCFGGINGLNLLDPKAWVETDLKTTLRVRELSVYDNDLGNFIDHTSEAITQHTLEWSASITHFVLRFSLDDYTYPERNHYAYKISGWIEEWQDLGSQHELRINTPPAGDYQLMLKGMGGNGIWSNPRVLDLHISPAFYERPGFWIASLLGLTVLVVATIRWRLRRLTREKQRLETEVQHRTREIEEQKEHIEQQAAQLVEMDQLKSRFFANVSHELRTPITLINGYIDRLFRNAHDDQRNELAIALRNGKQLQHLVEEILDLSKIDSSNIELIPKDIELRRFVEVLMDGFRSEAEHRTIDFTLHMGDRCPSYCRVDDNKLGKVLNNLISNALKFTSNGGSVHLGVDLEEMNDRAQLVFRVKDTGRGIHPDDLPHIFDRYFQTAQSDVPLEGGTGIGLAFSQELSKVMQGSLQVTSTLNEGSEFELRIPYADGGAPVLPVEPLEEPVLPPIEAEVDKPSQQKKGATLLLVEDNRDMQEFIRVSLGPDFQYKLASDGMEALEVLQHNPVDLVVTDLMMPRMDGFHLVEKLKVKEETKGLPVILLTARAAKEDRIKGLTIGVDDYLTKPFDATELKVRISNLLGNKQQREAGLKELPATENKAESVDQVFVRKAEELVLAQLEDSRFGVIDLAEGLLVSQRTLSRKMKLTTGMSPLKFIHNVRLEKAYQLLQERKYATVSEVMHAVGWHSGGHFARMFDERFGKKPSSFFES